MSIVAMALYNPLIPAEEPVATRTLLPCSKSRVIIIRVRRTLSEVESDVCGRPKSTRMLTQKPLHPVAWEIVMRIPVAI